jgi:ArsR family transcriptional regulator
MEAHMFDRTESGSSAQAIESDLDRGCDEEVIHPFAVMAARVKLAAAPAPADVATLFGILGDPTRIRVLTALLPGELCVCDLAAATGVNRTTISHQLRVLRDLRLVRRRREGKVVYYALDDDHVIELLGMASAHAGEGANAKGEQLA